MYKEEIHIGLTAKTSKVIDTIEFEEDDLIREGLGHKFFNGALDLHRRNYYIGEWLVDLWGRDEAGTLISECSFGGYDEAEWEGETSLDILRFWKLTKVETKVRRGREYYVIYSGKRHWDIDEELYQKEEDFLPVLFSLATDPANDVEFEVDGIYYIANDFHSVAVMKSAKEDLYYKGRLVIPPSVTCGKKTYTVTEIRDLEDCKELTEVQLPDTMELIAERAFCGCQNLHSVNFPDGLARIEKKAFWGCTSLEKIVLPKKCYVSECAFAFCEGLKNIVFSAQATLEEETFRHCTSLEKVTLPPSVRRLEPCVFYACSNLKTVVLNEGLETINGDSFDGCAIEELNIPKTVDAFYGPMNCKSLNGFNVHPENGRLRSIDGVLYSHDMETLEQCPPGREGELTIPDGVEYIGRKAFKYCSRLIKVVIPDSVFRVGWESFYGCKNLETVVIGDGVEEIGTEAFAHCEKLSTIVFGRGLKGIDDYAFRNCKALTKVILPEGLKHMNKAAFEGCSLLEELIMPEWMEYGRSDIMDYAHGKKSSGWR